MVPLLLTQSVETDNYREIEHNGRTYWVVDVRAAKPMELNGGYVPQEEFERSIEDWENVPLPLGHPVNESGEYISARIPEVIDQISVGNFHNAYFADPEDDPGQNATASPDVGGLDGELWVDVAKAESTGPYGALVLDMIENGDPLEVSTAYRAELGSPGIYNGEYRDEVRVNLRPDHLALLPGDLGPGKCSVEDGCGTLPYSREQVANMVRSDHSARARSGSGSLTPTDLVSAETPAGALYCAQGDVGANAARVEVPLTNANAGSQTDSYSCSCGGSQQQTDMRDRNNPKYTRTQEYRNCPPGAGAGANQQPANGPDDLDEWGLLGRMAVKLGVLNDADVQQPPGQTQTEANQQEEPGEDEEDDDGEDDDGDDDDLETNQQEGDIVRWDSDAGIDREPDDSRYGVVVDLLQDDEDDIVLVAVYAPDPDEGEWTNTGSNVRISEDRLTTIEQYPSMDSVNTGTGTGSQTGKNTDNGTDTDTMTDYDIEKLAAQTKFSEEELEAFNDAQLESLSELVNSANPAGEGEQDEEGDDNDDDDGGGDDDAPGQQSTEADSELTNALNGVTDSLEDVNGRLESFDDRFESFDNRLETLEENHQEQRQSEREELIEEITSVTNAYEEETLESMEDDALEATHAAVANTGPGAGPVGTDFSGIPSIGNTESSSSANDDSPEPAGTLAEYNANKGGD